MTPKEKAAELVEKFIQTNGNSFFAKDCALIAVNEILNHHSQEQGLYRIDKYYWYSVINEIKNFESNT